MSSRPSQMVCIARLTAKPTYETSLCNHRCATSGVWRSRALPRGLSLCLLLNGSGTDE